MTLYQKALSHLAKGEVDSAWFLAINDGTLNPEVTKEAWLEFSYRALKNREDLEINMSEAWSN